MSERLTKRKENGGVQFSNGEYWNTVYPQNENCLTDIHRMAIKLCELEDKIEQGKIVELPCAVGQTVYWAECNVQGVIECKVFDYEITRTTYYIHILINGKRSYPLSSFDFNKRWFLTKAAAEAKLREMEGERE
ncbi:MAG: hypothetical protein IKB02_05685 [Clostridia bacterium]|nr:hypothetical protein [Clostridia bacterium]